MIILVVRCRSWIVRVSVVDSFEFHSIYLSFLFYLDPTHSRHFPCFHHQFLAVFLGNSSFQSLHQGYLEYLKRPEYKSWKMATRQGKLTRG